MCREPLVTPQILITEVKLAPSRTVLLIPCQLLNVQENTVNVCVWTIWLHEMKRRLTLEEYATGINDLNDSFPVQLGSLSLDDPRKRNLYKLKDGMNKSRER